MSGASRQPSSTDGLAFLASANGGLVEHARQRVEADLEDRKGSLGHRE